MYFVVGNNVTFMFNLWGFLCYVVFSNNLEFVFDL